MAEQDPPRMLHVDLLAHGARTGNHQPSPARRVLFVDQSGEIGGAQLSLLDIARHRRHDSEVVLLADGPFRERLAAQGVVVRVEASDAVAALRQRGFGASALRGLLALPSLVRRVARRAAGADVVYANTQRAMAVCVLGKWLHRRPVVWHLRDIVDDSFFGGTQLLAIRWLSRGLSRVVANSQASADAFRRLAGEGVPVDVVHNGIDPAPFDAALQRDRMALRVANGLPARGLVVGLFGRLTSWKGHRVLMDAVSRMPDTTMVVVGGALFGEHAYEASLRERAAQPDLAERVHFTGFRADVAELMHCMDVVVHASTRAEPFGRVVVEGMLAARPVVATAAGGVTEIVDDGETGILIPCDDAPALAAALTRLADAAERDRMGVRARAAAVARFSPQAMLTAVDRIVADVARRDGVAQDAPAV